MIEFTPVEVAEYYRVRLSKLNQRGIEWRGPCPIHKGTRDSFAVDPTSGRWFCFSTCGRGGDVLALEQELFTPDFKAAKTEVFRIVGRPESPNGSSANGRRGSARGRIAATYDYTDEDGRLLYQAVRMDPKDFRQRQPDGKGGWVWNIKGVRLVLYHLPGLLKRTNETVFICEGEKDVHSLEALGLLATCNPMGAGKWRPEFSEAIRGRTVVLLPDNDPPVDDDGKPHYKGQKHAAWIAADLLRVGCEVRIVELSKGKDVSEWLGSAGTVEELRGLVGGQPALTVETLKAWRVRWEQTGAEPASSDKPARPRPDSRIFHLTNEAVIYVDPDPDKEPLTICGRLDVVALTRHAQGNGWGRLLRWADSQGRVHEWAMPMSLLAGDGSEYRARLLDGGLFIAPGRKQRDLLTVYLQTAKTETRVLSVERIGWHQNSFVLPGATIGPCGTEGILFQTAFEAEHHLNMSGTHEEWRQHIGRFCSGNSRLVLAVSCAFAGPVLSLTNGESGGVHLVGATSTGKSTALRVGGSVLGGGGRNGFVQSLRATANGLEAMAEMHNDLTLFLDELAQMDPREAAETVYLLGNGCGKARMSRNIGSRKSLTWCLIFMSAGELTLADHVQTAGKRTRGGAEVRLLNIEADAGAGLGLFEDLHGASSPDEFARQLKDATDRYYGAPLRAYLESVTSKRSTVESALRDFQADFLKNRVPAGATGEVFRAAQRFATIAAAGELATSAGITGWEAGEATKAAERCFRSWIEARGTTRASDTEAAINQVRRFLEAHGASRFQQIRYPALQAGADSPDENQVVPNRAGYRRKTAEGETEFLVLPETFKSEVCAGFDYRMVARALADRGFLDCQPPDLTKRVRLPGNLGLTRAFCVKGSILEG